MTNIIHMKRSHRFRPLSLLLLTVAVTLALGGCGNSFDDSSGPSNDSSSSSSSGGASGGDQDSSDVSIDDDTADETTDSGTSTGDDPDAVGADNEPSGDGLSGDQLATSISRQYQTQWEELLGMPMDDEDAPVRCDALEAQVGATTECEVKMAEGLWMPLDVETVTVTSVGVEYTVTPNLYG